MHRGGRTRPSWFLVSEHDNAIPPDAERFFAERMKATTEEINGSHCAFISQPVAVANFIKKALADGVSPQDGRDPLPGSAFSEYD